jgi:hypothetical protein
MYRNLTPQEVDQLERQGNIAEDWSTVQVAEPFCAECIRNSTFEGAVSLGSIEKCKHTEGDLTLREGIYNSALSNSTVGNHPVIHNVHMLSGYMLGDNVVLFNIEEMTCTSDPHKVAWLEPMNETGGRRLLPFSGMTIGEAYMWARYRGHKAFVDKLEQMTYDTLATD